MPLPTKTLGAQRGKGSNKQEHSSILEWDEEIRLDLQNRLHYIPIHNRTVRPYTLMEIKQSFAEECTVIRNTMKCSVFCFCIVVIGLAVHSETRKLDNSFSVSKCSVLAVSYCFPAYTSLVIFSSKTEEQPLHLRISPKQ